LYLVRAIAVDLVGNHSLPATATILIV
jgi:hypothetical protein